MKKKKGNAFQFRFCDITGDAQSRFVNLCSSCTKFNNGYCAVRFKFVRSNDHALISRPLTLDISSNSITCDKYRLSKRSTPEELARSRYSAVHRMAESEGQLTLFQDCPIDN